MDKNTWIGFLLIAAIIVGFTMLTRPSKEEIAARQRINDSIAVARQMEFEAQQISAALAAENEQAAVNQHYREWQVKEHGGLCAQLPACQVATVYHHSRHEPRP